MLTEFKESQEEPNDPVVLTVFNIIILQQVFEHLIQNQIIPCG